MITKSDVCSGMDDYDMTCHQCRKVARYIVYLETDGSLGGDHDCARICEDCLKTALRLVGEARGDANDVTLVAWDTSLPHLGSTEIMASNVELTPDQRKRYEQMTKDFSE